MFDQVEGVAACKSAGIEFYSPLDSELEKWKGTTKGLADEWVASYDENGLPGQEIKDEGEKILDMYEQAYMK